MLRSNRIKRHIKIRKKISGITARPRLSVFKSNKHIFAQIIDDQAEKTLVSESDIKLSSGTKQQRAFETGKKIAQKAVKKNIKMVVFDRGGFLYHGRIEKFASGAREGGLEF